ncbi:hypothetical protein [Roseisolibacter sp. H3M3-2]|uniref:hypothetical protein n=1 Tax=Roseisolibacter sp. H3M3-2 TaxID=3031323 RepID=UPI0023DC5CEF|nr:hypothetical protein [Roseisolibacter sp. H3M3-2]MDF1501984.1 hypothetical protein [Roseisolibacter sp. H3M3-2]
MPTAAPRSTVLLALLAAACASSGRAAASGDAEVVQTTRPVETGGTGSGVPASLLRGVTEDFVRKTTVEAPPEAVWGALTAVYEEFKLPINTRVDAERRLGTAAGRFRERVAGERAARIVSCGTAADGREAADSYELSLDIATTVAAATDGASELRTVVSGFAKPIFTNGEPVRCASTGRLEERIAAAARAKVAK